MTQQQGQQPNRSKGGQASAQPGHGAVSAAEVEKFIGGIEFPCDKQKLLAHAKDQGAPREVLELMDQFPDQQYGSPVDVARGVGKVKH